MDTKALRQKILDLAIHGRLVSQDPNDEPASVLLERIRKEKETLVKEGKIKKGKPSEPIDEVPFEVPKGWEWTCFGEICNVVRGGSPRPAGSLLYYEGDIPFMKVADLTKDDSMYVYSATNTIKEAGLHKTRMIDSDTLVLSNSGATLGVPKITKISTTINDGIAAFLNLSSELQVFCYWFLKSMTHSLRNINQGAAQPNLNTDLIKVLPIPLPPLSEQKRIVAEVEKWFALIDVIENSQQDLNTAIDQAKNKILDLAIYGKLVPNEGPWEEVSMQSQVDIISGVSYNKADVVLGSGIRILRGGNIQSGNIEFYEDDVFVGFQYKNENNTIKKGDIALVASTGSALLIGKTGFAKESMENTQIGAFLRIIRCKNHEQSNYINLVFNSSLFKNHIQSLAKGTNINNIKANYINDFVFPLPPLSEQKRIVEKIEQLFAALDAMKM